MLRILSVIGLVLCLITPAWSAEIELSNQNSKNVVGIAGNQGYLNRIKALIYEHALNLRDGTPSVDEGRWADNVLGGGNINELSIAVATAVQSNPTSITLADTATDAGIRTQFDLVIARSIAGWIVVNP